MVHRIDIFSLGLNGALKTLERLQVPEGTNEVRINFAQLKHVEPFGLLLISRAIGVLKSKHRDVKFFGENFSECSYAGHLGFFKSFGLDFGKAPGEAAGSDNYLPITQCSIRELREDAENRGDRLGDHIKAEAELIARVLSRTEAGPLFDALSYSIREIIRNVVEHSGALSYEYCAQYWPTKNRVEVGIVDRGIGIRQTLSNHPKLTLRDDYDALNWSLLPGISGKNFEGVWQDNANPYQNSGYGLFLTSQLCKRHGNFFIGSYDSAISLSGDHKSKWPLGFPGTAIRMELNTDTLTDIEAELTEIIALGEQMTATIPEAVRMPNSASKLLRGDFSVGTE